MGGSDPVPLRWIIPEAPFAKNRTTGVPGKKLTLSKRGRRIT
jgi:hypothetical protein